MIFKNTACVIPEYITFVNYIYSDMLYDYVYT